MYSLNLAADYRAMTPNVKQRNWREPVGNDSVASLALSL